MFIQCSKCGFVHEKKQYKKIIIFAVIVTITGF